MKTGFKLKTTFHRSTLPHSAKFAEGQLVYTPDDSVNKENDKVDKDENQTTVEEISDETPQFAVDRVVPHAGEADEV